MRGVIATDKYHTLFEVWQFNEAVRFKIPRGATLLRACPFHAGSFKRDFGPGRSTSIIRPMAERTALPAHDLGLTITGRLDSR